MSSNSSCTERKCDKGTPAVLVANAAIGAAAIMAISMMAAVVMAGGVAAQTLTVPKPKTGLMPAPPHSAESHDGERTNACSSFGPGFAQLPGTDACVKIGGTVTIEGTGRHSD
jgi:Porin subfamily